MNARAGDLNHAIDLLRSIIDKAPADTVNRMRLLTLLHAKGRRYDFVVEAHNYKANCDLTFDTNWGKICEMGRHVDPDNEFFGRPTAPDRPKPETLHPAPAADRSQTESAPEPDRDPQAEKEAPRDGSDRRDFVQRRHVDRRKNYSAWFGEERRKYQQRQKQRRTEDRGIGENDKARLKTEDGYG